MALSKISYTSIHRVLHNRTFKVRLSAVWKDIYDELGIGEISDRHIILSPEDHDRLREWVLREAGTDPLTTKVSGDRLVAASLVRNEKWATDAVFSGMMHVNVKSGVVPLAQGDAATPPGTLLSVSVADIITKHVDTIVLVENGIVARYWHKCRIPAELSNALMVYRGHGADGRTVRQWVKQLPCTIKKIGYFDFDPAGLGMAIDYEMDAILIPDPLDNQLIKGINNKPESHVEQLMHRPGLGEQLPESCHEVWKWMTSEGRKCAVTQERMTEMDRPLRLLSIID
ncbi:MAG: hypothetical protein QNL62_05465 [Gammaproteobacteria bacterium]|nr:hypothetical protein [Gammaproteobacteria bacterium]